MAAFFRLIRLFFAGSILKCTVHSFNRSLPMNNACSNDVLPIAVKCEFVFFSLNNFVFFFSICRKCTKRHIFSIWHGFWTEIIRNLSLFLKFNLKMARTQKKNTNQATLLFTPFCRFGMCVMQRIEYSDVNGAVMPLFQRSVVWVSSHKNCVWIESISGHYYRCFQMWNHS